MTTNQRVRANDTGLPEEPSRPDRRRLLLGLAATSTAAAALTAVGTPTSAAGLSETRVLTAFREWRAKFAEGEARGLSDEEFDAICDQRRTLEERLPRGIVGAVAPVDRALRHAEKRRSRRRRLGEGICNIPCKPPGNRSAADRRSARTSLRHSSQSFRRHARSAEARGGRRVRRRTLVASSMAAVPAVVYVHHRTVLRHRENLRSHEMLAVIKGAADLSEDSKAAGERCRRQLFLAQESCWIGGA